jgi:hypothetical protein
MPEETELPDETEDDYGPFEFVIVVAIIALLLAVTAFLAGCAVMP